MHISVNDSQITEDGRPNGRDRGAEKIDFSIVLVNFDSGAYIEPCLDRLRRQAFDGTIEIIVLNHLSTDGSLETLKGQSDIRLIDPGKNLGFSGGNNLGIRASRGTYVLCLNFDCFLTEGFLQKIFDAFEAHPDVGMISGKLRKMVDQRPTNHLDSTGIDFVSVVPADRGEWQCDRGQYDQQTDIFGPSGAAGCYRRRALDMVAYKAGQFFDEQMFIYCEDIDLAWRLNLAGWRGLHVPDALAHHERGATRKRSLWKQVQYYRIGFCNRYFAIVKNLRFGKDLRGRLGKLRAQELRTIRAVCGKSPLRWLVGLSVLGRLAWLVLRPSFIAKRRLAHKYGKGDHLDLAIGTDLIARFQQRLTKEPLAEDSGRDQRGISPSESQGWSLSAARVHQPSWNGEAFFRGMTLGGPASLKITFPEKFQDRARDLRLCFAAKVSQYLPPAGTPGRPAPAKRSFARKVAGRVARTCLPWRKPRRFDPLAPGETAKEGVRLVDLAKARLMGSIDVLATDGAGGQSQTFIMHVAAGREFLFELDKTDVSHNMEALRTWQRKPWASLQLNFHLGRGFRLEVTRLAFLNGVARQHDSRPQQDDEYYLPGGPPARAEKTESVAEGVESS